MASKSVGESLYHVSPGDPSASVEAFIRRSAKDVALSESWFRDAIAANPELVVAPCREAGLVPSDERWFCWKTEFGIETGSIDVLLVSSQGRIGIVETKLSYNPQIRREVVAQLLDYALALRDHPFEALPPVPTLDGSPIAVGEDIEESMANGDFLLIIAGDALDPRAIRLGKAVLAQHSTSMWDLAMVDMNLFHRASSDEYLLVPELRGTVEHETRQTIRVTIQGESPKARVEVERVTTCVPVHAIKGRLTPWTIEEACNVLSKECRASILRIFTYFNEHPLVRVEGGRGLKEPTLSLLVRATNEKAGITWLPSYVRQAYIALRAARLLELHGLMESELIEKLQGLGFTQTSGIGKDGNLALPIPSDISDDMLDKLAHFVTGK
jgi:hypothetical protein